MTDATWAAVLLWTLVFIYAIAGSIDFGSGFWALFYFKRTDVKAAMIASRYLSPLWEVTNVFLVLFAVSLVVLFPHAAFTLGNMLLVPGNLILILLTIRTVFMVYAHTSERFAYPLKFISGITGLLIPALLLTVFPIAQGGFSQRVGDHYILSLSALFSSPATYTYVALGILSELFLSSLFLGDYSRVADDRSAFITYRRQVLWLGPVTIIVAFICLWSISATAPWLRHGLILQGSWFVLSGTLFLLGMAMVLLARKPTDFSYRIGVIAIVLQYLMAMFAYGRAHMPYLVYPIVSIYDSFTNAEMFRAAIMVLIIGIAILFPGFIWFWRLFLENKAYLQKS